MPDPGPLAPSGPPEPPTPFPGSRIPGASEPHPPDRGAPAREGSPTAGGGDPVVHSPRSSTAGAATVVAAPVERLEGRLEQLRRFLAKGRPDR